MIHGDTPSTTEERPDFWRVEADYLPSRVRNYSGTLGPGSCCPTKTSAEQTAANFRKRGDLHNIRITPVYLGLPPRR